MELTLQLEHAPLWLAAAGLRQALFRVTPIRMTLLVAKVLLVVFGRKKILV
jgi:hypothetical protein